jgi:hypothetical protein
MYLCFLERIINEFPFLGFKERKRCTREKCPTPPQRWLMPVITFRNSITFSSNNISETTPSIKR